MDINKFKAYFSILFFHIKWKNKLGQLGKGSIAVRLNKFDYPRAIYIFERVYIASNAWIMGNSTGKKSIEIHGDTTIGNNAHIIGTHSLVIEESVLIADNVFITDCSHIYKNIHLPIRDQGIKSLRPVRIGSGSWIGENVCIIGSSIGKNCVIGANAVVTKDVPDYSVVIGNPARIIKHYDLATNEWIREDFDL